MKKILFFVTKRNINRRLINFLNQEFEGKIEVFAKKPSDVYFEIINGEIKGFVSDISLEDFDFVYFRKVGKHLSLTGAIALYLDSKEVPYIDSLFENIGPAGNKLYSLIKMVQEKIPVVDSIYCSREKIRSRAGLIEKKLGYPFFMKDPLLQRRKGVFLVKRGNDLEKVLNNSRGNSFIFQKYVHIKEEYRILVLGNDPAVAHREEKRSYKASRVIFRPSNTRSAFIEGKKVPKEMNRIAIKAAKSLKLDIAGVDIARDHKGKVWIFEVNRAPGITENPKISPEPLKIAEYFLGKFKVGQLLF